MRQKYQISVSTAQREILCKESRTMKNCSRLPRQNYHKYICATHKRYSLMWIKDNEKLFLSTQIKLSYIRLCYIWDSVWWTVHVFSFTQRSLFNCIKSDVILDATTGEKPYLWFIFVVVLLNCYFQGTISYVNGRGWENLKKPKIRHFLCF